MTEAAPWSDHLIEPGPDSPLAVTNRTWVETVQRVMAERDSARRWAKRWKTEAKQERAISRRYRILVRAEFGRMAALARGRALGATLTTDTET